MDGTRTMINIGFVYNVGMGTSQLCIWDEDSKTLTLKDVGEKRAIQFSECVRYTPPPDCILMQSAENV